MTTHILETAPARSGWLRNVVFVLTRYIVVWSAVHYFALMFYVLNTTKVYGRKNLPKDDRGIIFACWHERMPDSYFLGTLFAPRGLFKPDRFPWNLPAAENYYRSGFARWLMARLNTIPVDRSTAKTKSAVLHAAAAKLREGNLLIFPGGTRFTGGAYPAQRGIGHIALFSDDVKAIVPIAFTGMSDVQPYRKRPGDPPNTFFRIFGKYVDWHIGVRFGKTIRVRIGKPIPCAIFREHVWSRAGNGKPSQYAADLIMERIRALREELLVHYAPH